MSEKEFEPWFKAFLDGVEGNKYEGDTTFYALSRMRRTLDFFLTADPKKTQISAESARSAWKQYFELLESLKTECQRALMGGDASYFRKLADQIDYLNTPDLERPGREIWSKAHHNLFETYFSCLPPDEIPGGPSPAPWQDEVIQSFVAKHGEHHTPQVLGRMLKAMKLPVRVRKGRPPKK